MASIAQLVSEIAHSVRQPNNKALRENLKLLIIQTRNEVIRRSYENHKYVDKGLTQRFKVSLVSVNDGDIIRIDSDGKLSVSTFEHIQPHYNFGSYRLYDWYDLYGIEKTDEEYENDLLMICGCYGVDREDVELLFEFGYSSDEVEEMLMDHDLFEQAMEEIKTLYQR